MTQHCKSCSELAMPDRVLCQRCSDKAANAQAKRRAHLRDQGLCYACGKYPHAPGKTRCQVCITKANTRWEARKQKLLTEGFCIACGKEPFAPSSSQFCASCLTKYKIASRERRKQLREQGLCSCGNPIAPTSKHRCRSCLDKRNAYAAKRYRARKEKGLCAECNRPNPSGAYMCPECSARRQQHSHRRAMHSPRAKTLKRDNHKCRLCEREQSLQVHHRDGQGESKNGRRIPAALVNNDIDNLITLCARCHNGLTHFAHNCIDASLLLTLLQEHPPA